MKITKLILAGLGLYFAGNGNWPAVALLVVLFLLVWAEETGAFDGRHIDFKKFERKHSK